MSERRVLQILCGIIGTIVAVGVLMHVTVSSRTRYTCVLCRGERTDRTLLGYSWQRYRDTDFTDWYRTHRVAHRHEWVRLTCTRGSSIFGTTTFYACGLHHPVCEIPPDLLRQFVEHADASTLESYFDGIVSADREAQDQAVQIAWDYVLENE